MIINEAPSQYKKRVYVVKLYNVYIYQNIAVTIQQQITSSKYGDRFR